MFLPLLHLNPPKWVISGHIPRLSICQRPIGHMPVDVFQHVTTVPLVSLCLAFCFHDGGEHVRNPELISSVITQGEPGQRCDVTSVCGVDNKDEQFECGYLGYSMTCHWPTPGHR